MLFFELPESYNGYTHAAPLQYRITGFEGDSPHVHYELNLGVLEDDGEGGQRFVATKVRVTDNPYLPLSFPLPMAYYTGGLPAVQLLGRYAYAWLVRQNGLDMLIPAYWAIPEDWGAPPAPVEEPEPEAPAE